MDPNASTRKVASPFAPRPLPRFRVASPCSEGWESMTGDEKRRRCALCRRHVVDPTAMTQPEIDQMLEEVGSEEGAGVRAWRREDGTLVLGGDCAGDLAEDSEGGLKRSLIGALLGASLVALIAGFPLAWTQAEHEMADPRSPSGQQLRSLFGMPRLPIPMTEEELQRRREAIFGCGRDTRAS